MFSSISCVLNGKFIKLTIISNRNKSSLCSFNVILR